MKNTEKNSNKKQPLKNKAATEDSTPVSTKETGDESSNSDQQTTVVEEQTADKKSVDKNETVSTDNPPAESKPSTKKAATTEQEDHTSDREPVKKQKKPGATWPGKLALLLSLIALCISAYLYWLSLQTEQQNQATFDETISQLKAEVADAVKSTEKALANASSTVDTQVRQVNDNLAILQSATAKEQQSIAELQERLTDSIQQVMAKQSNSRKDWLLAESEYLLRLANQRILMEKTSSGALALLKSTDAILKQTDDVSIYPVRKALASDIAALEAVPTFDLEGRYLQLSALNELVDQLRITPLTDQNTLPSLVEEMAEKSTDTDWTDSLKASWAKAVDKFEKLVVIQHRDEKVEALMSPEQTYYLQQNLHLMLEQAQLALLQKEQALYDKSLVKAEQWLNTYFDPKDATTQALLRGINDVKNLKIAPELPDISGSLKTLKGYLHKMTKLKEEGAA